MYNNKVAIADSRSEHHSGNPVPEGRKKFCSLRTRNMTGGEILHYTVFNSYEIAPVCNITLVKINPHTHGFEGSSSGIIQLRSITKD